MYSRGFNTKAERKYFFGEMAKKWGADFAAWAEKQDDAIRAREDRIRELRAQGVVVDSDDFSETSDEEEELAPQRSQARNASVEPPRKRQRQDNGRSIFIDDEAIVDDGDHSEDEGHDDDLDQFIDDTEQVNDDPSTHTRSPTPPEPTVDPSSHTVATITSALISREPSIDASPSTQVGLRTYRVHLKGDPVDALHQIQWVAQVHPRITRVFSLPPSFTLQSRGLTNTVYIVTEYSPPELMGILSRALRQRGDSYIEGTPVALPVEEGGRLVRFVQHLDDPIGPLSLGHFIRIRTGLYRRDIARVVTVNDSGIVVEAFPRFSYQPKSKQGKRKHVDILPSSSWRDRRPPPRPFDAAAADTSGYATQRLGSAEQGLLLYQGTPISNGMALIHLPLTTRAIDALPNLDESDYVAWWTQTEEKGRYSEDIRRCFFKRFAAFRHGESLTRNASIHFVSGPDVNLDQATLGNWTVSEVNEQTVVVRHPSGQSKEVPKESVVRRYTLGDFVKVLRGSFHAGVIGFVTYYEIQERELPQTVQVHVVRCIKPGLKQFFDTVFDIKSILRGADCSLTPIRVYPWELELLESHEGIGLMNDCQDWMVQCLSRLYGGDAPDLLTKDLQSIPLRLETPALLAHTSASIGNVVLQSVARARYAQAWKEGRRVKVVADGRPNSRASRYKNYHGYVVSALDEDLNMVWLDAAQREVVFKSVNLVDEHTTKPLSWLTERWKLHKEAHTTASIQSFLAAHCTDQRQFAPYRGSTPPPTEDHLMWGSPSEITISVERSGGFTERNQTLYDLLRSTSPPFDPRRITYSISSWPAIGQYSWSFLEHEFDSRPRGQRVRVGVCAGTQHIEPNVEAGRLGWLALSEPNLGLGHVGFVGGSGYLYEIELKYLCNGPAPSDNDRVQCIRGEHAGKFGFYKVRTRSGQKSNVLSSTGKMGNKDIIVHSISDDSIRNDYVVLI